MSDTLVELFRRVADMERRQANMVRHGTVAEVDPAKGRMRLKIGEGAGGSPFLSPWVPYAQVAGALKVHAPPSVGQQMTMFSPTGDVRQAVAMPMTWSDQNAAPSQSGSENVITFGSCRIELKGDEVLISGPKIRFVSGGHSQEITGAGSKFSGGRVEHEGKNIGKDHTHGGIVPGNADTDIPNPQQEAAMPKYVTTELSGEYVAGRRNPGAGTPMILTKEEAEHDLRVGALREWGEPVDAHKERAEAATAPASDETGAEGDPATDEPAAKGETGDLDLTGAATEGEAAPADKAVSKKKK